MKRTRFSKAFPALALATVFACTDAPTPTEPAGTAEAGELTTQVVPGPEALALLYGQPLPEAFSSAPLISSSNVDAGFGEGYGYAVGQMTYWATHARIDIILKIFRGATLLDTASATASNSELLPGTDKLVARATISVPQACGHRLDARASFSAWMGFPIPPTGKLFTWGHVTQPGSKFATQPVCPPYSDDDGSLDGEDEEYEGGCEVCQEWLVIQNNSVSGSWWECSEVDPSVCGASSNG